MLMPAVQRSFTTNNQPAPLQIQLPEVVLPTQPSEISQDINDYNFLFHGLWKIGKTTLATVEDNVFLLTLDPLHKSMSLLQQHCPNWSYYLAYLYKLEEAAAKGQYPYRRLIIDGTDLWYRYCFKYT